ncbi:unnamed protein product [Hymenolepis diminuta]|uniref:EGF-like domain-containing protein n=1 Tax=Hymenolepis diminuta TaxID=6216 RepID=A0A0R3SXJ4_HYMDI|nr:unnamed protein product [Hymenolepis diminuta]
MLNFNSPFLNTTSQLSPPPTAITKHRSTREAYIPQYCSKCSEGSVCLVFEGEDERQCFCRPDYYGEFCDQLILKLPETCTKTACENGGICQQGTGQTTCICPINYVGTNCSRVALWVQVEMNIDGSQVHWDGSNQTASAVGDVACNQLIISIKRGQDPILATSIIDCHLKHLEKTKIADVEGMRLKVLLKFDPKYNETAFDAANVIEVLQTAPYFSHFIRGDFVRDKTANITSKFLLYLTIIGFQLANRSPVRIPIGPYFSLIKNAYHFIPVTLSVGQIDI